MGGFYGKLLIAAFITFNAVILGFIIMCVVGGRKGCKALPQKADTEPTL